MDLTQTGGLGNAVNTGFDSISNWSQEIQSQMTKISEGKVEDQTMAMMQVQFEIGQYNAMLEMTSNITKTISDALKSVAQKL